MNHKLVWRCIFCTYDNEPISKICAACSRARDTDKNGTGTGTADAMKKQQKRIMHRQPNSRPSGNVTRPDSEQSISSGSSLSSLSCTSLSCSSTWLCPKCFLEMNLSQKVCTSCNTERRTLSNFPHNLLNNRDKHNKDDYINKKNCQLKPTTSLPPLRSTPPVWTCDFCSHQNNVVLAHCVMCNASQPDTQSLSRPYRPVYKPTRTPTGAATRPPAARPLGAAPVRPPGTFPQAKTGSRSTGALHTPSPLSQTSVNTAPMSQSTSLQQDLGTRSKTVETNGGNAGDKDGTYNDIVQYFRKLRTNFVDDSFRPCDKSIYGDACSPPSTADTDVRWLRPHEIDGGYDNSSIKWTLFRTPLPTDIIQGSLGDCWLLSSLSVLADRPSVIEKIFAHKSVSNEGIYQIRLCKDGMWVNVVVDDYFPCYSSRKLMFAQSDRKQLWVPLIEKAVAKLYGSYQSLKAGHCGEGLQLLTGAPVESIKMSDYEDDMEFLWGMLLSYKDAGYPIGVCCMGEEEQAASLGLTTRHAYSLLNLHSNNHLRLIQLRNPWAKDTWLGKYSNKCPSWTEELRAELLVFEDSIEAVFWIELTDFVKYFTIMDVCRLHHDWKEWRLNGVLSPLTSDKSKITYISVCETTRIDVSLIQPSSRGNEEAIVDLSVAILSCTDDNEPQSLIEYSTRSLLSNITCSTIINPGTYMIVPMAFLHIGPDSDREPSYVLAVFVDKNSCVWQGGSGVDTLSNVLYKVAVSKGQHREALQGCSVYQLNKKVAGLIMAVENRNPNRYFHISCDNHQTSNVVSTRGQITTSDWIPPLSRMIIMILTQLDETCGFKIQSSYKFSLTDTQEEEVAHLPRVNHPLHNVYPL